MATPVYIDKNFANKLSKFTQDKELNPDNFRVFKDVTAKQQSSLSRLKLLLEKTSLNESEKQEVSELQIELRDCMPTSEDWNMLQSSIYNIQCYMRDGIVIFESKLASLKRFKDDAKEVARGYECGLSVEKFNDLKEGDIIESYEMVEVKR